MASVLVAQFQARDAEGRVYPMQEFQEAQIDGTGGATVVTTYKLAIGDRINHLGGDEFELVQNGKKLTRIP